MTRRPSLSYRAVTRLLHMMDVPGRMMADMAADRTRVSGPPIGLRGAARFTHEGHPVYRFAPRRGAPAGRVLHLHGGAFVYGLMAIHYRFAAKLARLSGAEVWLPEYPLPPGADARAVTAWSDGLAARAMADGPLVLMGDSAGGGLALGAAQRRAEAGEAMPEALVLLSPWTDLTCPDTDRTGADEPLLSEAAGLAAARRYAGGLPLDDPLVSPLFGPLSGLPPVTVVAGERDVLWPDIARLRDALEAAGAKLHVMAEPQLGHYWKYYPVPEARRTTAEIAAVVRTALV